MNPGIRIKIAGLDEGGIQASDFLYYTGFFKKSKGFGNFI